MTENAFSSFGARSNANERLNINKVLDNIENSGLINDDNEFTKPYEFSTSFNKLSLDIEKQTITSKDAINELDQKIANLEKESAKTQKGIFSSLYNMISKKDNTLDKEITELKAIKEAALADDGKIDANEMKHINKELKDADEKLIEYKKSKKSFANLVSTCAVIALGICLAPFTGGTSLLATAGGIAAVATICGIAKVGINEQLLDDEYEALGKEGLKDGLIAAAYSVTGGVLGAATKTASLGVKVGVGTAGDVGITIAVDKDVREQIGEGNFTDIAIIAGSSLVFRGATGAITASKASTGIIKASKDIVAKPGGKIILTSSNYTARKTFLNNLKSADLNLNDQAMIT